MQLTRPQTLLGLGLPQLSNALFCLFVCFWTFVYNSVTFYHVYRYHNQNTELSSRHRGMPKRHPFIQSYLPSSSVTLDNY